MESDIDGKKNRLTAFLVLRAEIKGTTYREELRSFAEEVAKRADEREAKENKKHLSEDKQSHKLSNKK